MIKRRLWIVLMCVVVLAFTGCGGKNKVDKEVSGDVSENEYVTENESVLENETVTESENVTEKEETQKNDNKKDDATTNTETKKNNTTTNKNESTSNKNETTTKPSTGNTDSNKKPSTGSTTKPSTGSTNNSGSAGITGNTQNNSTSTTTQPSTPAHTHSWTEVKETVVVQEAWVEDVYAWRTICGRCGLDMTEMEEDKWVWHVTVDCNSCYSAEYIKIDEIQHPAVTEERVTGYKCSCGATK